MPYVFDFSEWEPEDDEDEEMPEPKLADFFYLAPPDVGGAADPVTFAAGPDVPADAPLSTPPTFLEEHLKQHYPDQSHHAEQRREARALMDKAVAHLRTAGLTTLYVRYDGGSDEGFAWLDHAVTVDGRTLERDAVIDLLAGTGLHREFSNASMLGRLTEKPKEVVANFVDWELSGRWIGMLLSTGFGTGQLTLYGAATVDLAARTITDDPKAAPIVQNIGIADA
jgi:hypothetical protein